MKTHYKNNTLYNFRTTDSLIWFVITPILLAAVIILLLFVQIGVLVSNHKEIASVEEVIMLSMQGKNYALQLQSSVRGYIIAGSEDYLIPYKNNLSTFDENLRLLEKKMQAANINCVVCGEILETKKEWIVLYSNLIERKSKSVKYQPSGEELDISSEKMSNIIKFFDNIIISQTLRLSQIRTTAENNVRNTTIAILIASIITAALFGALIFLRMRRLESDALNLIQDLSKAREQVEKVNNELEDRVLARTEELRAANVELETFCYSVSHDLRAPLRGIDGFSLALNEEYGQSIDAVGKKYLGYIRIGVQKMGRIIDDLLKLSKVTRQVLDKMSFDFSHLVESVIEDTIKENPHKTYEIDKSSFKISANIIILADERLMRIALENLISNAWKFSRKKENPRITIGTTIKNDQTCFFIEDNGAGFDMNFAHKLFNPFQRLHTESEFEGTGIGLATVRRIILKHGGEIWAESRINVGSTFYFTLPERNLNV